MGCKAKAEVVESTMGKVISLVPRLKKKEEEARCFTPAWRLALPKACEYNAWDIARALFINTKHHVVSLFTRSR